MFVFSLAPGTPPPTVLGIITFKHLGYALFLSPPARPVLAELKQADLPRVGASGGDGFELAANVVGWITCVEV